MDIFGVIIVGYLLYLIVDKFILIQVPKEEPVKEWEEDKLPKYNKEPIRIDKEIEKEFSKAVIQNHIHFHSAMEKKEMLEEGTWDINKTGFFKKVFDEAAFSVRYRNTDLMEKLNKIYPNYNDIIIDYEEDDIDKILDYNIALPFVDIENLDNPYQKKIQDIRKNIEIIKSKYGLKHYEDFIQYGYIDIVDVVNVAGSEILEWDRIGKKTLEKIQSEQETAKSILNSLASPLL